MYKLIDDSQYRDQDFFNFDSTSQLPRHRWYYLKEGFSTSLVNEAIYQNLKKQNQELNILEPFCGTGTTPLTAALNGHYCLSIEVNPFIAFTAQVKTVTGKWHKKQFKRNLNKVIVNSADGSYSDLEGFSTFTEREGLSKWLFNKSVLRRFSSLVSAIEQYGGTYKDAFKLAAIVAAYSCCNAKRDGKALRYKSYWQERRYTCEDLIEQFRYHALNMLQDVVTHPISHKYNSAIMVGDSREELSTLTDDSFDLVVTSPPYLNSFDYSDIYRPELFLGDYIKNNIELKQLRLKTLRSHVQVKWPEEVSFESSLLSPIVDQLNCNEGLWNNRIPVMINAYFDDMWKIFKTMKPKMRTGGEIWLVVSTSCYGGVHIPVDLIIADAANQAGFSLKGVHCLRHLRAAGQQWKHFDTKAPPLRESLIIMSNE